MSEEHELEKLVINNLEIVEQSKKLLTETIDPEFKRKLECLLMPELHIDLFDENCGFSVNNPDWYSKKWDTLFIFDINFQGWDSHKKSLSYLSFCTNVENVEPGIFFEPSEDLEVLGDEFFRVFEKKGRNLYGENKEKLDSAGFILRDGYLYRPFQLDFKTIAADWPNLTLESIRPLLDAFNCAREVSDIFDVFVKKLTHKK